jgi:formate hydrogenlyase transcriptional activator
VATNGERILGNSAAMRTVLTQVSVVALTDSTVLIMGETGTGKELVARAVHDLSERRNKMFVRINCAAIPAGLLESELFGHEKGAFTGAISRSVGRFELADQGTLFLDEIGDIPPELQPKLLRVLQEQEFERLGSTRSIRVNVRVVAATNRDLRQMMQEHEFRADLFYRLNVFPIQLPPLRERTDDIPLLVRYFVSKYAEKMGRRIDSIPAEAIEALRQYPWPGNIRELQNFIERAVILSPGSALRVPMEELQLQPETLQGEAESLGNIEREHILRVLRQTDWVLAGQNGAAARLHIPRTTLLYKMRRLGISRKPV